MVTKRGIYVDILQMLSVFEKGVHLIEKRVISRFDSFIVDIITNSDKERERILWSMGVECVKCFLSLGWLPNISVVTDDYKVKILLGGGEGSVKGDDIYEKKCGDVV